jgi:peptide/nickel transport system ATP-binding protein
MAGHSRSKNGVASARLCPAIHRFSKNAFARLMDARIKSGHDE